MEKPQALVYTRLVRAHGLAALAAVLVSVVFVYLSFYGMRIGGDVKA